MKWRGNRLRGSAEIARDIGILEEAQAVQVATPPLHQPPDHPVPVDCHVQRGRPCPRPEKPSRSGVPAIRPAGTALRSAPRLERLHLIVICRRPGWRRRSWDYWLGLLALPREVAILSMAVQHDPRHCACFLKKPAKGTTMNPSNTPTSTTKKRRRPFLFDLLNREGRDLLFLRVQEGAAGRLGLHMDLDSSEPESVLVFVRTDIPADRIVHEVQQAKTDRVAPRHLDRSSSAIGAF